MRKTPAAWEVKRPLFVCGLTAVTATAVALKASLAVTMAVVVPFAALLFWKRLRLCAAIALCFLLVAVGYRHVYALPAERLEGQTDTIEGVVLETPDSGRMYTVRITHSNYLPKGNRVMLRCPDQQALDVGDCFVAEVELLPTEDNQTNYSVRLAFACAFPDNEEEGSLRITYVADQKVSVLQRVRTALTDVVRSAVPPQESGLLAALCFGETRFVQEADTAAFRSSGLSHLLAVSGLHLSLVALAIRRLLRRWGMYPRCLLTLSAAWLFALFVGAAPSVLRAAVMLSLWIVGCLLFCRSDGLSALGLAAIILLAANPYTLWNVGFQLSFAATLGVLVLSRRLMPSTQPTEGLPWWRRLWQRVRDTLVAVAAVSVSALLFTLPIACYHYGGLPITALQANLLACPAAGATMLCGWLGAIAGVIPLLGWLSNGFLLIAALLMRYIATITRLFSPDAAWITASQPWQWLLLTAVCALAVGGILWRIPRRRVGVVLLTLSLLTAAVGIPFVSAPIRLTVVPADNEGGFILQQGRHCALIVTDDREINEIDYDTPAFDPEVLIALHSDPSAVTQLTRWPAATLLVAAPADWADSTDLPLTVLPVGSKVTLWQDCTLVRLSAAWTLVNIGGYAICIGTDPREACPYPDGWLVYVGCAPTTTPDRPYTVVCNDTWLRRYGATLMGEFTLIYDQPVTFTPLGGEWRTTLWL